MPVTATSTARELVEAALRKAGVLDGGEQSDADMMANAIGELNRMLKTWQATFGLWTRDTQVVTVTSATQSYTLAAPARPVRVLSARYRRGTIDTPMQMLTRDEYEDLPVKSAQGLPTTFYYERKREQGTLFVWPVLATATGETIRLTIEREIEDVTAPGDAVDVPAEWYDAVVYGLAARLCDEYERNTASAERVRMRAPMALREARAFDMDETVFLA